MTALIIPTNTPLVVVPELAEALGSSDKAIMIQQIHYLTKHSSKNHRHETINYTRFVRFSYSDWHNIMKWKGKSTLVKLLKQLKKSQLLFVRQINNDLYYAVNYFRLGRLLSDAIGCNPFVESAKNEGLESDNKGTQNDNPKTPKGNQSDNPSGTQNDNPSEGKRESDSSTHKDKEKDKEFYNDSSTSQNLDDTTKNNPHEIESWRNLIDIKAKPREQTGLYDIESLWDATYGQLQLQLDKASFESWFSECVFEGSDKDGKLIVSCRHQYSRDMCQFRLYRNIRRVASDVIGRDIELLFFVRDHSSDLPEPIRNRLRVS